MTAWDVAVATMDVDGILGWVEGSSMLFAHEKGGGGGRESKREEEKRERGEG